MSKGRLNRDGLPVNALDWTEDDWRDLHVAVETIKRRVAARHRKEVVAGDPLRPAALAAYEVLNQEYGNACRNGYFPDVKPVLDGLRAALGLEG